MKAIINGVRYDTEKAEELGYTDNIGSGAESITDLNFWSATLYKTPKSGRYFLAGEGRARSMFAVHLGNGSYSGGERIIPFEDEKAAFDWVQREFAWKPELIEKHFGHLIEDA